MRLFGYFIRVITPGNNPNAEDGDVGRDDEQPEPLACLQANVAGFKQQDAAHANGKDEPVEEILLVPVDEAADRVLYPSHVGILAGRVRQARRRPDAKPS